MIRAVLLAALVYTVSAGVISGPAVLAAPGLVAAGGVSYASGPALGAPLLGRVTYNAPEVNIVKQPITIDQPEIHYKAVPTLVQPQVTYISQPVVAHQTLIAQPAIGVHKIHL
ncbi:unnamed protein product [Allacma fusca]|uniref:Uncharacterized protein n=1 Tax=Allacma fusca TaxID=39272 RepID=A0A8J2PJI0_9HEXA|nr:unnamed protein product [Allacma fusca]